MSYSLITNAQLSTQVYRGSYGSVAASPSLSGTNLVYINDGHWYVDKTWALAPADNVVLDTAETYQGSPSWKIPLSSVNSGVDHAISSIKPGDHICFCCWIKTSDPTLQADVGNPQAGGRIGIDFYGSLGGIVGVSSPDGTPNYSTNSVNTYVRFGTSTWTQMVMNFTVPSTYQYVEGTTGQTGHYSTGQMVTPTSCLIWLQVHSDTQGSNEHGTAWFANPVFIIT